MQRYEFKPRGGYVSIVRDDNREQVSAGGVVAINLQPSQTGVVMAVGDEVPPGDAQPGDRIVFSRVEAMDFPIGPSETLTVLHYKQVFGKLTVEVANG
jgi:co-chaperonin GroES (HSP10)